MASVVAVSAAAVLAAAAVEAGNELAEIDLNQQLDDLMEWEHLGLATDFAE